MHSVDGYWTTRGCHRRLCVLSFHSFAGICETRVVQLRRLRAFLARYTQLPPSSDGAIDAQMRQTISAVSVRNQTRTRPCRAQSRQTSAVYTKHESERRHVRTTNYRMRQIRDSCTRPRAAVSDRIYSNTAAYSEMSVYNLCRPRVQTNYRLFVPKTFRSQERKVPIENFRSPGTKVPGNEKSRERKFPIGTIRSWERKVLGTKSPGTVQTSPSNAYRRQTTFACEFVFLR